ncbi:MAG: hypothetical protein KAY37_15000 [Phycisphaerae bacterium]|nr:hypothetical protein [Phycisphaerae bacterium]
MSANQFLRRLFLLVCIAALGRTAQAQEQPTSQQSAALVDLNRAIQAYAEEDREAAAEIFERLLEAEPTAEQRVTCNYYLGLIGLEHGLEHSSAAQAAKAQGEPETADQEAAQARAQFEQAQQHFETVVRLADPTAEIVNAALLLGIAQLASDFADVERASAYELSQRAEETLQRYVTETEDGARSRYGQFYLAVARYRLADEYRGRAGMAREYAESLQAATWNLEQARVLADADLEAGRLTPAAHEDFNTVLTYYDALLAILQRDNPRARALFTDVATLAEGTDLATNAEAIVNKLDEVETSSPLPLQLPLPKPLGPLEFQGRLRVGNWYDSNVILLGRDTALPRGYKQSADYQFGITADFNISRYIPKTEAPWVGESLTVGVGGGAAATWQPNIPQFDVNRYPGRAYVNWQPVRDLYLGLQYEYSYTLLGHKPFISSQRLTPVISKIWRRAAGDEVDLEAGRTDIYYTHDERNYLDRIVDFRLNRDGVYQSVGVQHLLNLVRAKDLPWMGDYFSTHEKERVLFGEKWLSCYLGYEYRDEQTVGTEFDLRGHSIVWGLDVPLPHRFAFELDGELSWAGYTAASVFDYERKERSDFVQRYDFSLTYTFVARGENPSMRTLDVKLRTGVELTFQNSNIWNRLGEDIYEYDRAVYGVQLEVDF